MFEKRQTTHPLLAIFAIVLLALAAQACGVQGASLSKLKTSAEDYHRQVRFSRFTAASRHVAVSIRATWLKNYHKMRGNLQVADIDLVAIERCGDEGCKLDALTQVSEKSAEKEATKADEKKSLESEDSKNSAQNAKAAEDRIECAVTQSSISWYLLSDGNLHNESILSQWCYDKEVGSWFIVEQIPLKNDDI